VKKRGFPNAVICNPLFPVSASARSRVSSSGHVLSLREARQGRAIEEALGVWVHALGLKTHLTARVDAEPNP
jgi:hypothetical protein